MRRNEKTVVGLQRVYGRIPASNLCITHKLYRCDDGHSASSVACSDSRGLRLVCLDERRVVAFLKPGEALRLAR